MFPVASINNTLVTTASQSLQGYNNVNIVFAQQSKNYKTNQTKCKFPQVASEFLHNG